MVISFFSQFDASDWIALAAVIISILTGYINYRYTRCTFTASFYPKMQLAFKVLKQANGNIITVKIKNLSPDYSITDLYVEMILKGPGRIPLIGGKRIVCSKNTITALDKSEEKEIILQTIGAKSKNIEDLLATEFPDWIQMKNETIPGLTYILLKDGKIKINAFLTYLPGVMNAKRVRVRKKYDLVPKLLPKSSERQVASWSIKDLQ